MFKSCCAYLSTFERRPEVPPFGVVPFINEFWNTLSNAPFIIIALLRLSEEPFIPMVHDAYFYLILIGIGSSVHHATTPKWTIIIDWIPILWALYFSVTSGLWQAWSWCVLFELGLAFSVLVVDHTTTLIPVPWGHVFWHVLAAFAIEAFLQNAERLLLFQNIQGFQRCVCN